jgi:SAM-dependent methyltransferase
MIRRFLSWNQRRSEAVARRWPYYGRGLSINDEYIEIAGAISNSGVSRVVDVGAGRSTPYVDTLSPESRRRVTVVGVDVLPEDLRANAALDERVTADVVSDGLPSNVTGADLVTSRMVAEHVEDLDRFAAETFAALAPGGRTVHLFAARYSIFAILNRILSDDAARRILYYLRPATEDVGGFVTHYDRTHFAGAKRAFEGAGFSDVRITVSYNVSSYFGFFLPFFVLARLFENALRWLRLRNLGAYVLLEATKPPASSVK